METQIKDKVYYTHWSYDRENGEAECIICTRTSQGVQIISRGEAICSEKDNFNYETARKLSLKRALTEARSLWLTWTGMNAIRAINNSFWESYRTLKKQPRWN